jgi:hypothetical protein
MFFLHAALLFSASSLPWLGDGFTRRGQRREGTHRDTVDVGGSGSVPAYSARESRDEREYRGKSAPTSLHFSSLPERLQCHFRQPNSVWTPAYLLGVIVTWSLFPSSACVSGHGTGVSCRSIACELRGRPVLTEEMSGS